MWNEQHGNLEKALRQMEKAVQNQPRNQEYLFELARLGHILGRRDMELEIYDTTLRDGSQQEGISLTVNDKLRRRLLTS